MSFGDNVQILRKEKNLSQEKLADDLNVSRQCISKWELDSAYPETEKLIALSEYFNVSIDTLIKGNIEIHTQAAAPGGEAMNKDSQTSVTYRNIRFVIAACLIMFSPFWSVLFSGEQGSTGITVYMMSLSFISGFGLLLYNYLSNPKRLGRKEKKAKT